MEVNMGVGMGMGPASAEERDSSSLAAPPGVGGCGVSGLPGLDPSALLRAVSVPAASGDGGAPPPQQAAEADAPAPKRELLPSEHATRPNKWERLELTGASPQLTVAEVVRLVRNARRGQPMAGARVVREMAGDAEISTPKAPACRTHAARRWTRRVVGRAVGLKQLKPVIEALRPIMAERARRAARKGR